MELINHLIVFIKNPELGKVKTRLAKTVGEDNALYIYKLLIEHTYQISLPVNAEKHVYYSSFIENSDQFNDIIFRKNIQKGKDLGERMSNAIKDSLGNWASKVVLIGSDCYELNSGIIEEAFLMLDKHDVVIGPAEDGGYYLIGMKNLHDKLFKNKEWSGPDVMLDTILDCNDLGLSHYLLPTLNDVDEEEDLGELKNFLREIE